MLKKGRKTTSSIADEKGESYAYRKYIKNKPQSGSLVINEGKLDLSSYTKPAALVAILVFFIVSNGLGKKETISSEPF